MRLRRLRRRVMKMSLKPHVTRPPIAKEDGCRVDGTWIPGPFCVSECGFEPCNHGVPCSQTRRAPHFALEALSPLNLLGAVPGLGWLVKRFYAVRFPNNGDFPDCRFCGPCRCDDECGCAFGPCVTCGHVSGARY